VVGILYLGDICVNEEIINAGFAWVYRKYCKDAMCRDWLKLAQQAKGSSFG
jgi:micrococcal nuclease